ncbi:uncharacterized protein [Physcomitrium patens]|uniref:Allyl alcohol dehydrogenase-like protein n=1 Tax=Physcomitrium patens TaxID=3218 RepID=A0A2K1JH62_PHYPA|nr:hypothetical protein PHYPA_018291 [Physcomitrium patens]
MGFFGRKKKAEETLPPAPQPSKPNLESPAIAEPPKPDINAAFKSETSVFEFGSSSDDGVTLAGYCPVSDEMEPCRWEILPSGGKEAPKFRIIF